VGLEYLSIPRGSVLDQSTLSAPNRRVALASTPLPSHLKQLHLRSLSIADRIFNQNFQHLRRYTHLVSRDSHYSASCQDYYYDSFTRSSSHIRNFTHFSTKMSVSDENGSSGAPEKPIGQPVSEDLNVKVTGNNEVFKIKRTTPQES
jgi:hypothetical protein